METLRRQSYLDWLRILSILGVLFFHAAMPYVAEDGWHIKNKETSELLLESNYFLHLFRMPLLFFISGAVSYLMMQRRSSLEFTILRFRRLFLPLLVGMFLIVPPQIYIERLNNGFTGSYWAFYKSVFHFVPYPKGNFSWHHLWFIAYLFVYDILFAPLFAWLVSARSLNFRIRIGALAKGKRVYLLMLPGIIWYSLMSRRFPETNDLINDECYFVYWLLFLLTGFICIMRTGLIDSLERNRRFALTIGFVSLLMLNYLRWNDFDPLDIDTNNSYSVFFSLALRPLVGWSWVLALVGYGKKYLDHKHKILNYLNPAVYPFYILHQTVIVILSYYFVKTQHESILSKYLYTVAVTFFITALIYHLLIRPVKLNRFLFGMKPIVKILPAGLETAAGQVVTMPDITRSSLDL